MKNYVKYYETLVDENNLVDQLVKIKKSYRDTIVWFIIGYLSIFFVSLINSDLLYGVYIATLLILIVFGLIFIILTISYFYINNIIKYTKKKNLNKYTKNYVICERSILGVNAEILKLIVFAVCQHNAKHRIFTYFGCSDKNGNLCLCKEIVLKPDEKNLLQHHINKMMEQSLIKPIKIIQINDDRVCKFETKMIKSMAFSTVIITSVIILIIFMIIGYSDILIFALLLAIIIGSVLLLNACIYRHYSKKIVRLLNEHLSQQP